MLRVFLVAVEAVALQAAAAAQVSQSLCCQSNVSAWEVNGGGQVPMKAEDGALRGWDKRGGVEFSQHCLFLAHRCATPGGSQSGQWLSSGGCDMSPQK